MGLEFKKQRQCAGQLLRSTCSHRALGSGGCALGVGARGGQVRRGGGWHPGAPEAGSSGAPGHWAVWETPEPPGTSPEALGSAGSPGKLPKELRRKRRFSGQDGSWGGVSGFALRGR